MPCSDGGPPRREEDRQNRLDAYARMLCYMCGDALADGRFDALPLTVHDWWKEHHERDTLRVHEGMLDHLKKNPDCSPKALSNLFYGRAVKVHAVSDWHKEWFERMANDIVAEFKAKHIRRMTPMQLLDVSKKLLDMEKPISHAQVFETIKQVVEQDKVAHEDVLSCLKQAGLKLEELII